MNYSEIYGEKNFIKDNTVRERMQNFYLRAELTGSKGYFVVVTLPQNRGTSQNMHMYKYAGGLTLIINP